MEPPATERPAIAEVRLGSDSHLVVIRIVGHPSASGVPVEVEGACESFRGSFEANLGVADFERLHRSLVRLDETIGKRSSVEFESEFPAINLQVIADATGHLEVHVRLTAMPWGTESLAFSMACDQTYLPDWIASLERVLKVINVGPG